MGNVLRRIASLTNVLRTRKEDGVRRDSHGGEIGELNDRMALRQVELSKEAERLASGL